MQKILILILIAQCTHRGLIADQPLIYTLVDQVCGVVESELPVLQSEVVKRAQERSISNYSAQRELLGERALWIYAKQQLKYNVPEIFKNAQEHTKKAMENNKLDKESFERILRGPPYFMTLQRYEYNTAFSILKNHIESSLASNIVISDKEVEQEYNRQRIDKQKEFAVIFVSVLSSSPKALVANPPSPEFIKANAIKKEILSNNNPDAIKRKYKDHKGISFVGPLDYQEGALKQKYDIQIKKDPAAKITEPFEDGGMVTMIWKVEKTITSDNQKTALENVRKGLYTKAVHNRLEAVKNNTLAKSSVEINCEW